MGSQHSIVLHPFQERRGQTMNAGGPAWWYEAKGAVLKEQQDERLPVSHSLNKEFPLHSLKFKYCFHSARKDPAGTKHREGA